MSQPLDRLTLLETFARIADRGSISAAARDLGLSQASASRQLKALEDRLGIQLVRRTTHDLSLTSSGAAVLQDARILLADWTSLSERHGAGTKTVKGPLSLVAPVALGQRALVDIAVGFQHRYPEVTMTWQLQDEPIRVAETGCDCWIKVGPVTDETLIVRKLAWVDRLVIAHPDFATKDAPGESTATPFVALDPFDGARISLTGRNGQSVTVAPTVRFSTNNVFAVHRAALAGIGAAVLPRWFVEDDLASGRLIDLWPTWRAPELIIHAAYLPSRHLPERLRLFLDAVTTGLQAVPGLLPVSRAA